MSRNLHHANLLIGTPEDAESYLRLLCDSLSIRLSNNPDFFAFKAETFGIDEAREVRLSSTRKAITAEKIFLITPTRLTLEAQNALLKTFEDPSSDNYFFLVAREEGLIVPTLRSRMQMVRVDTRSNLVQLGQGSTLSSGDGEKFLSLSLKDRLIFAKSFVGEEKNLVVFLDNLLYLLRKRSGMRKSLEKVYKIRRLVSDSLMTSRLVLEHLSLML